MQTPRSSASSPSAKAHHGLRLVRMPNGSSPVRRRCRRELAGRALPRAHPPAAPPTAPPAVSKRESRPGQPPLRRKRLAAVAAPAGPVCLHGCPDRFHPLEYPIPPRTQKKAGSSVSRPGGGGGGSALPPGPRCCRSSPRAVDVGQSVLCDCPPAVAGRHVVVRHTVAQSASCRARA